MRSVVRNAVANTLQSRPLADTTVESPADGQPVSQIEVFPATSDRWEDLVQLFGEHGAAEGCWCMWFRQTGREHWKRVGEGNKVALHTIIKSGDVPGLLAYHNGHAVGWCSVAPRSAFGRLQRSPTLKPVDDQPVWSIVCFFVAPAYRDTGVASSLLRAAVDYAAAQGARIVEGYPVDPGPRRVASGNAYTGLIEMFRATGFQEVLRRSPSAPIMRFYITRGELGHHATHETGGDTPGQGLDGQSRNVPS